MKQREGQLLLGVIVLLLVLAILIPAMVLYIQHESRWSEKQAQNTNAFQLAEAAVDRAYQKILESTSTWKAVQNGQPLAGYSFDVAYGDLPGGSYAISITSGPARQQATVLAVGRDKLNKEIRALKVVYSNPIMSGTAIHGGNAINLAGTDAVEWGAVISPNQITVPAGAKHPQFYSAANIVNKDSNGPALPNTDSLQWWSYYTGIPQSPPIDFDYYLSSAIATGTCISEVTTGKYAGCVNSGQNKCGGGGWAGGGDHDCNDGPSSKACKGYTWYINCPTKGIDITANNNTWVIGDIIIIGDMTMHASAASGHPTAPLPQAAWKQYANDWSYYLTRFGDRCAPQESVTTPAFPGLNSTHLSPASCTYSDTTYFSNVINHGFLYVSGNAAFQTGGRTQVWGAAYIGGTVSVGAGGYVVYFDPEVASGLVTTRVNLVRQSWQDTLLAWPAGLP